MSRLLPLAFLVALLFQFPYSIFAQSVSISLDGSPPDSSALLDVKGNTGGLLVPRMTMSERIGISSPATGLLVYQTDSTSGFFYFGGAAWHHLMTQDRGWNTDGNAGTTQNNFIGTTDNKPLRFRVHDTPAGMIDSSNYNTTFGFKSLYTNIDGSENTSVGFRSLFLNEDGSNNSAFGNGALMSNVSGYNNTAIGSDALNSSTEGVENTVVGVEGMFYNMMGSQNTATGMRALYSNISGSNNTAFGWRSQNENIIGSDNASLGSTALFLNKFGGSNTAIGSGAMYNNLGGSNATAIGYHAMHNASNINAIYANYSVAVGYDALRGSVDPSLNTGNYNTAIGSQSQLSYSTGSRNTSSGFNTLNSNTTGSDNTAVGHAALSASTLSNQNTAIGSNAFIADTNFTNSTAIGFATVIDASNSIRLGNMSITSIGGIVDWSVISDGRFKTDVAENVIGLEFIDQLRPVTYRLDMNAIAEFHGIPDSLRNIESEMIKGSKIQSGLIAQEVESLANSLNYEFSGVDSPESINGRYSLRYAQFVVPLVKAVQEQQDQIDQLTNQMLDLVNENMRLNAIVRDIQQSRSDIEIRKSTTQD